MDAASPGCSHSNRFVSILVAEMSAEEGKVDYFEVTWFDLLKKTKHLVNKKAKSNRRTETENKNMARFGSQQPADSQTLL